MELTCLYRLFRREIEFMRPDQLSWQQYVDLRKNSLDVYIYPCYVVDGKNIVIDITAWLSDHPKRYTDIHSLSWQTLGDMLTPTDILSYKIQDPGFLPGTNIPSKAVHAYELTNLPGITVHYYDAKSWDQRSLFHYRYNLPDLLIVIEPDSPIYTRYKNCIPVIQGYCLMPQYYEDEIYRYISVPQGARYLWSIRKSSSVSLFLLDFTPYGGIHCLEPLSDQKLVTEYSTTDIDRSCSHLTCQLQDTFLPLHTSTVFLVYSGILYDPSYYTVINPQCFTFLPRTLPLEYQQVDRKRLITSVSTCVVGDFKHPSYLDRILNRSSDIYDAFIFQVPTPHIYRYRYQNQLPTYAYTTWDSYGKLPSPLLRSRSTYKLSLPQLATYQRYTAYFNSIREQLHVFDTTNPAYLVGADAYRGKKVPSFTEIHATHYDIDYWVRWM